MFERRRRRSLCWSCFHPNCAHRETNLHHGRKKRRKPINAEENAEVLNDGLLIISWLCCYYCCCYWCLSECVPNSYQKPYYELKQPIHVKLLEPIFKTIDLIISAWLNTLFLNLQIPFWYFSQTSNMADFLGIFTNPSVNPQLHKATLCHRNHMQNMKNFYLVLLLFKRIKFRFRRYMFCQIYDCRLLNLTHTKQNILSLFQPA